MKTKLTINPDILPAIIDEAALAAKQASDKYFETVLNGRDSGACGFAWIHIRGIHGNSKLAKALANYGITKDYSGALCWWNPARYCVQNVDCLESGAFNAATVLRKYGFDAMACSRLD